jgi:ribosomal protein S18 acetylase RimI-like enzyme
MRVQLRSAVSAVGAKTCGEGESDPVAEKETGAARRRPFVAKLYGERNPRHLVIPMSECLVAPEAPPAPERLELAVVSAADLPLLERLARAYYLEDRHVFDEDRQPAALAALVAGEAFGDAWLTLLDGRPVGYVVLSWGFSVEAGGREACLDEIYLVPEVRDRGLGSRVLALLEAETRARGVRRVFLEVERHNRAIGLYRRAGYVDHDRFLMSKFLDP